MSTQEQRCNAAYAALSSHELRCHGDGVLTESNIVDLLANLMHIVNAQTGYNFESMLQSARNHYEAETGIVTP